MSDTEGTNLGSAGRPTWSPRSRAGAAGSAGRAISWIREAALLPVLVVLLVVGAILNPHFLTVSNITGIGQQASALGVVVVGESLILLIGGLDLSLEATYGLAPDARRLADRPGRLVRQRLDAQPLPRHPASCSPSARWSAWSTGC